MKEARKRKISTEYNEAINMIKGDNDDKVNSFIW